MVARQPVTTLPKYDEMVTQKDKLSSNNTRPENSVVRTIGAIVVRHSGGPGLNGIRNSQAFRSGALAAWRSDG